MPKCPMQAGTIIDKVDSYIIYGTTKAGHNSYQDWSQS